MIPADMLNNQSCCFMVATRVRHTDAENCTYMLQQIEEHISKVEGFMSFDVIRRDGGLGVDFYTLTRFNSEQAAGNWKSSPERHSLVSDLEALAIEDVSRQQEAGSNIWFQPISLASTPKPPLLWKRWLLSMIAVYPALIVLVMAMKPITKQLSEPLGLFLVAFVLTGLTTAYIAPFLSKNLHSWLIKR
jgi:uncharacterized protein